MSSLTEAIEVREVVRAIAELEEAATLLKVNYY